METREKRSTHIQREQVTKILYHERAVQQKRFKDLEDALTHQNYEGVSELMGSLEMDLNQLLDPDGEVVEVQVRPRRKAHKHT